MSKKILAALLAVCMIAGMLFVPASAATFKDVDGHWAADAIERWAGYGVLEGHGDGTFTPDAVMTRAQFAAMLVKMLGLTAKSDKTFGDVPADAWYADVVSQAVKAGIINGRSADKFAPNDPVTFEEAAVMMCRAFGLAESKGGADWAKESIDKLTELGMIGADVDEHLQVGADCNRAVVAALADKVVAEYANDPEAEALQVTGEVKGVVLAVKGAKVDIKDATLAAPIVVESASVTLTNTKADNVIVSGKDAAITADEASSVADVTLGGEAPKADIKGEVGSVTITEETTGAVVDAPKAAEDAIVNNSASDATVNGETMKGEGSETETPTPTPPSTDDEEDDNNQGGGNQDPPPAHTEHEYKNPTSVDNKSHKSTCSCGDVKIEAHTWGTDENDADTYNKCTVCGLAKPADKEEIVDGDVDKKNDANHGDECTWVKDESKADKAATCTEDGVSYFICKKTVTVDEQEIEVGCGATKTVTTPATGHTAADKPTEEVTKEPTCMATGTKKVTVTCKTCSAKISESSVTINVDKDAHDVAEGARWVSDEEGHWHACKLNSNHKADYAVHDYQEDAETGKKVCECGKEEPCKHANKSYEALANKKHKVTCDDCGEVISASADCTAGDWVASGDDMVKKCTACKQVLETCTHENVTYGAAAGDEGAKKHSATCADCAKQLDPVDCNEDENCQYCKTEAPDTPSTGR